MYFLKKDYTLLGFQKSNKKQKKYDAKIENKKTGKIIQIPFGDNRYESYQDKTGLDLYPVHGNKTRRASYRARHMKFVKKNYYSPGYFSYKILW